jgi:hypothetical protein
VAPDGTIRSQTTVPIPSGPEDWAVARAAVQTLPGDRLRLVAVDPLTVQSVRGFVGAGPLVVGASPVPGWTITGVTDDAVVLEPGA